MENFNVSVPSNDVNTHLMGTLFSIQANTAVILGAQATILAKLNNSSYEDEFNLLKTSAMSINDGLIKHFIESNGGNPSKNDQIEREPTSASRPLGKKTMEL